MTEKTTGNTGLYVAASLLLTKEHRNILDTIRDKYHDKSLSIDPYHITMLYAPEKKENSRLSDLESKYLGVTVHGITLNKFEFMVGHDNNEYLVLLLEENQALNYYHQIFKQYAKRLSYNDFKPHVTLAYTSGRYSDETKSYFDIDINMRISVVVDIFDEFKD